MMNIEKESLAPIRFESLRQEHRVIAAGRVTEIVFCLYLCNGIRRNIRIEEIAAQASITYPDYFFTWVAGERVPDLAIILLTLKDATSKDENCVIGDWSRGWHLTKRGLCLAKDIERRRQQKGN